jgi:hypothetical protein
VFYNLLFNVALHGEDELEKQVKEDQDEGEIEEKLEVPMCPSDQHAIAAILHSPKEKKWQL